MKKAAECILLLGLTLTLGCVKEYIPGGERPQATRQFRIIPLEQPILKLFYDYSNFGQGGNWLSYNTLDKTRNAFAGCRTNVSALSTAKQLLGPNLWPTRGDLVYATIFSIGLGYMPIDTASIAIIHDGDTVHVLEPGFVGLTFQRVPGAGGAGAMSFVFHERIRQAAVVSPDSLYWVAAIVGETATHELGHARGLSETTHSGTSGGHSGQNSDRCVMKYKLYVDQSPIFCDAHKDAIYAQTW